MEFEGSKVVGILEQAALGVERFHLILSEVFRLKGVKVANHPLALSHSRALQNLVVARSLKLHAVVFCRDSTYPQADQRKLLIQAS